MMIVIVTAMKEEFAAVMRCFGAFSAKHSDDLRSASLSHGGHEIVVAESGMGFDNAAKAARWLIDAYRPQLLLSCGFCGAVTPELHVGDVVVAQQLVIAANGVFEEIPLPLADCGRNLVVRQDGLTPRMVNGVFISSAAIFTKKRLTESIQGQYRYPVVEMESGAIALVAGEYGLPMVALRAVSDAADEEIDFTLEELCSADLRRISLVRVAQTVIKRPSILPQLVRLNRGSRQAARSLTTAITSLFSNL